MNNQEECLVIKRNKIVGPDTCSAQPEGLPDPPKQQLTSEQIICGQHRQPTSLSPH